jgi:hypothetical protein
MARPRTGQAKGGELIALAMAAALLFFVGREAVRTARQTSARRPAERRTADTLLVADVTPTGAPARPESLTTVRAPLTAGRIDNGELRRRIDAGSPGTYMPDMLVDRDSMLTRWPERTIDPVRVWVQRKSAMPDWSPQLFDVVRTAFDEWGAVGQPIRFTFTVDSARADIHVNFADRVTQGTRLGVTTHRYDQNGWIVSAEIMISTHDTSGSVHPLSLIAAIARHEIGHALGLGHSRDRATIMYPESETLAITGPDRATLKLLYSLPPGSVR